MAFSMERSCSLTSTPCSSDVFFRDWRCSSSTRSGFSNSSVNLGFSIQKMLSMRLHQKQGKESMKRVGYAVFIMDIACF